MDLDSKQLYFKEIYTKEADNIFRFVFLRISNKEESVDITGEVFYKFWQIVCKEEVSTPRALLFTIARNKVIDWYRKKQTKSLEAMTEKSEEDENVPFYFQVEDEKADKDIVISAEASWVMEVLHSLPPQYKEVVSLRFIDGLSPQEIGEVLHITPNAASLRINHALEKMRKELGINIKDE